MVPVEFVEALPPRAGGKRSTGVPEELSEVLNVLRTKPGAWALVGTDEEGGTTSPLHRKRTRWLRVLEREGIVGFDFKVRDDGCGLYGRKVA